MKTITDPEQYIEAAIHADLEDTSENLKIFYSHCMRSCDLLEKEGKKEMAAEGKKAAGRILKELKKRGVSLP